MSFLLLTSFSNYYHNHKTLSLIYQKNTGKRTNETNKKKITKRQNEQNKIQMTLKKTGIETLTTTLRQTLKVGKQEDR